VNPEQQIRAAAAQATATLMSTVPPPPADFIAMTEVVEAYIRGGKDAAFALCPGFGAAVEPTADPDPAPPSEPEAPAPAVTPAVIEPPAEPAAEQVTEDAAPEREAEVIPLVARGAVPQKQEHARRFIEKQRKERVDSLINRAKVAKAMIHKRRLMDEAEENQLLDYSIAIDGDVTTLGAYLSSLLGS